jgi:glutamate dehydrogenase/leucine dehydrogenase
MSLEMLPDDFCALLRREGRRRASFIYSQNTRSLAPSIPALGDLAGAIAGLHDFAEHEGVFLEIGQATGALLSATLHRTVRGQAAGGVRHWHYASLQALVQDGLRLSRGMGRKNALAGLWWGGGKGVIARAAGGRYLDAAYRKALYEDYGRFVTSLRGAYVTAEDVGTTPPDMAAVFTTTRFVTCVPEGVGGSGNPSPATAKGVVCAMEASLDHLGEGTLSGKRIAVHGTGNVGAALIGELVERGAAQVVATEVNAEQCSAVGARFAGAPVSVRHVPPGDLSVFAEECDIVSPSALGGVLNPDTIPRLRCKIVCGAANNQLLDEERDALALRERGVTFIPDFVASRMGIVSCANEQYGSLPDDPAILRHFGRTWENAVYVVTRKVLGSADRGGVTTTAAAAALADELSLVPHPLFPHRGAALVEALVAEGWEAK